MTDQPILRNFRLPDAEWGPIPDAFRPPGWNPSWPGMGPRALYEMHRLLVEFGMAVRIAERDADLPEGAHQAIVKDGLEGVKGSFHRADDSVWIVRSRIDGNWQGVNIALHEAFHRGLWREHGDNKSRVLEMLAAGSERVRVAAARQRAKYADLSAIAAIEEAMAEMSMEASIDHTRLPSVVSRLRQGAEAAPPDAAAWTDEELEQCVAHFRLAGLADAIPPDPNSIQYFNRAGPTLYDATGAIRA